MQPEKANEIVRRDSRRHSFSDMGGFGLKGIERIRNEKWMAGTAELSRLNNVRLSCSFELLSELFVSIISAFIDCYQAICVVRKSAQSFAQYETGNRALPAEAEASSSVIVGACDRSTSIVSQFRIPVIKLFGLDIS